MLLAVTGGKLCLPHGLQAIRATRLNVEAASCRFLKSLEGSSTLGDARLLVGAALCGRPCTRAHPRAGL